MMVKLDKMLESRDVQVFNVLQTQGIKMPYFAFRWLSLMLSQEFSLPDVLSLWDALLTDQTRCDLLMDVCLAMVFLVRDNISTNDFASNMKMLQNYPPIDVFGAHTLVTYGTFLHIQCVADLFHLRLALLLLHIATLLFVRSAALVLMGCHGLVLSVTVPVRLLGHVRCIHDLRQQYHSQASK